MKKVNLLLSGSVSEKVQFYEVENVTFQLFVIQFLFKFSNVKELL